MTNTHGSRSFPRRRRLITFIMVLALNLMIVGSALAAELVNGEFGFSYLNFNNCNTSGWTTSGTVSANTRGAYGLPGGGNDCVARVHAGSGYAVSSTLSQTATASNGHVVMWLDARSYLNTEGSQTVTIYNASGGVVYSQSHNDNLDNAYLCASLGAGAVGQDFTIEIKTTAYKSNMIQRWSTLYPDNVHFSAGCIWPNSGSIW